MASSSKGSGHRTFNPVMSGSIPAEVTIRLLRLIRFRTPASQAGNAGFKSHRSHHICTGGGTGIRTRLRLWILWVRIPPGVPRIIPLLSTMTREVFSYFSQKKPLFSRINAKNSPQHGKGCRCCGLFCFGNKMAIDSAYSLTYWI